MNENEITWEEAEEMAADMLDETYPLVTVGELSYLPSQVLKFVDPIAWREVVNDFADSEGYEIV